MSIKRKGAPGVYTKMKDAGILYQEINTNGRVTGMDEEPTPSPSLPPVVGMKFDYAASNSSTIIPPESAWTITIPQTEAGDFLWTRITYVFSNSTTKSYYNIGLLALQNESVTSEKLAPSAFDTVPTAGSGKLLSSGSIKIALDDKATKVTYEEVSGSTFELHAHVFYDFGTKSALTLTLASDGTDELDEYMFQFKSDVNGTTLSLPSTIKWIGDNDIDFNTTYQVSIVNNIAVMGAVENNV